MISAVKVTNLREFVRACDASDAELAAFMRAGLLALAEPVATDIRSRYQSYSAVGAGGVKAKVTRPGNAIVAQTLRKSRHPMAGRSNFGGLMMREAFLPGLDANEERVENGFERLIDDIAARHWEG